MTTASESSSTPPPRQRARGDERAGDQELRAAYLRFGAMIATAVVVMYGLTYLNTFSIDHVAFSEMRVYMAGLMGSAMAVIMLAFMLGMYRSRTANVAIVASAAVVFALMLWLARSQETVQDESYMRAMIPHHSIAILTSDRAQISDVRVQALAAEIEETQRIEIQEMQWLLDDIAENGEASSAGEAEQRPVPEFEP